MQTSTITVAVLPEPSAQELVIRPEDLDIVATTGSGPGGQHRNKTASAIQLTHRPTQTRVRIESERSQHQNRELALSVLRARLWGRQQQALADARQQARRQQIGSGMRGDKRRTIRADGVVDHVTGRRWRYEDYIRARW